MARIVSTGATLSSPEYRDKKLKERRKKLILWGSGILLLLLASIVTLRLERFKISVVKVEGANVISEEVVSRNVKETLSGSYLWVVPKANAAIYPRGRVLENLEKEFPRFKTASLSLTGPKSIMVSVEERDPYALYCPSALNPENASDCYFLDREGFIFDEAPAFSGSVYFIYAFSKPLSESKGSQMIPVEEFKPLSELIEGLESLHLEPLALEIGEDEAALFLKNGAKVLWKMEDDPLKLYSNLEAFLSSDAIRRDKEFLEKISVLDLRTENKVFYRFKEDESGMTE